MMDEEWEEELLRQQQDEEATFEDKYAEELEMMDEMEAGKWRNGAHKRNTVHF